MSYGDEQAESRRLNSFLKEGEGSMTAPRTEAEAEARQPDSEALRAAERYAAEAILDRDGADPDDDAAIVARAALRLAALPPSDPPALDVERLAEAIHRFRNHHGTDKQHEAIPHPHSNDASFAAGIADEYARLSVQPEGTDDQPG